MRVAPKQRFRAVLVAIVAFGVSFSLLRPAGELAAVVVRKHWPQAWFSGLIVWYANVLAVVLSTAITVLVSRTSRVNE